MAQRKNAVSLPASEGAYILLREPLEERKSPEPPVETSWPGSWYVFIFPYEAYQIVDAALEEQVPNIGDEKFFNVPHGVFTGVLESRIPTYTEDESIRSHIVYITQTSENYKIALGEEGTDWSKTGIYEGWWSSGENARLYVWAVLNKDLQLMDSELLDLLENMSDGNHGYAMNYDVENNEFITDNIVT